MGRPITTKEAPAAIALAGVMVRDWSSTPVDPAGHTPGLIMVGA
jgi:hypothetical protein